MYNFMRRSSWTVSRMVWIIFVGRVSQQPGKRLDFNDELNNYLNMQDYIEREPVNEEDDTEIDHICTSTNIKTDLQLNVTRPH